MDQPRLPSGTGRPQKTKVLDLGIITEHDVNKRFIDGAPTVYFRGRKLRGRMVQLPDNYQGLVLKHTEKILIENLPRMSVPQYEDDEDDLDLKDQDEIPEPVKVLQGVSTFGEFVVWGHDQIPACDDAFVKNIEEWINFAEAIHGKSEVSAAKDNDTTPKSSTI